MQNQHGSLFNSGHTYLSSGIGAIEPAALSAFPRGSEGRASDLVSRGRGVAACLKLDCFFLPVPTGVDYGRIVLGTHFEQKSSVSTKKQM